MPLSAPRLDSPCMRSPKTPVNQSIDALKSKWRSSRSPALDECKSPFTENKLRLPSLSSLPHKMARGDEWDMDAQSSAGTRTPPSVPGSQRSSKHSNMQNSQSLPLLHDGRSPNGDPPLEAKKRSRRLRTMKEPRLKDSHNYISQESPSTTESSRTPSTALGMPSPCTITIAGAATPSASSTRSAEPPMNWRRGEEIGSGTYGRVYMAQCKTTGKIFAAKVAKIRDEEDKKRAEKQQHELDIIKDLRHRHIVACLGHEFSNKCLYIYLEYVPGGSLRRMLNDFGALEEPLLIKATRGIAKGLNYLHRREPPVVHRDLKGANVLVDLNFCVKLADFGCSKRDDMTQSFSKVGSIHWVAPEVLQNGGHGRKADIWSLGCVVIEMATAADPWGSDAFDNIYAAVHMMSTTNRRPPIPDCLTESGRDFVDRCLQRQPDQRPNAGELVEHALVTDSLGDQTVRSSHSNTSSTRASTAGSGVASCGFSARSSAASTTGPALASRPISRSSSVSRLSRTGS
mmetsp:Transcript_60843/g.111499  ORF Transcript_60843/g.111499 Transcript_60843/m.111499 type:complete len:514 (+) Transcript_60843:63-1604(+)